MSRLSALLHRYCRLIDTSCPSYWRWSRTEAEREDNDSSSVSRQSILPIPGSPQCDPRHGYARLNAPTCVASYRRLLSRCFALLTVLLLCSKRHCRGSEWAISALDRTSTSTITGRPCIFCPLRLMGGSLHASPKAAVTSWSQRTT